MRPSITLSADLARQHELIDAAIAVNEAPTLDEAFQALVDAGITILGADRLVVVVWQSDLEHGVIRAGAGVSEGSLGIEVPSDPQTLACLVSDGPYIGPPIIDGLPSPVFEDMERIETVVR
ncbi:MAG TPA: hypothetical protein VGO39_04930, partial [Gaiellaceae bacterium]|nr:hypothetical protein [Gaiellaceae bacterium]